MSASGHILCIETSGTNCGVALVSSGIVVAHYSHWIPQIHDRVLADMTQHVLAAHSLNVADLQAVAVSVGPGSFTGLRIGVSFAKALCFGNTPGLIALPTLEAMACFVASNAMLDSCSGISAVVPAQSGYVYYQMFDVKGEATGIASLVRSEDLDSLVPRDVFVCGPAAPVLTGRLQLPAFNRLSAEFLSLLASTKYRAKEFSDARTLVPLYIQEFKVRQ